MPDDPYRAAIGRRRNEIETPALLVDLDVARRNISTMAGHMQRAGKHLRPHTKTHKTPQIARLQVEAGAIGVSTATAWEAVVMLEAYTGLLAVVFLIEPNVYLLLGALLPQAFVLPITDSYVIAHRLAATPDRLLGRAEAARQTIVRTAAPLGALSAGVLLSATSARVAVAALLAVTLGEEIYATAATALRSPPPLEEPA